MHPRSYTVALALFVIDSISSPVEDADLRERKPSNLCDGIKDVVDALKMNKATSFCATYLQIPTVTSMLLETVTSPSTTFVTLTISTR